MKYKESEAMYETNMRPSAEYEPLTLTVSPMASDSKLSLDFYDDPWCEIDAELIDHYMGEEPLHRPLTQFKIAYNETDIFVLFRVLDKYVRAQAQNYQGPVYKDSCVEFFFSPGIETTLGYFNLEINCCGQALFEFHPGDGGPGVSIPETVFGNIELQHQFSGTIEPEYDQSLVWSIGYRIPVSILKPYLPVTLPKPGAVWRANFYKCADLSSHPHWLTWSRVNYPKPRFHLPEYFGRLVFG